MGRFSLEKQRVFSFENFRVMPVDSRKPPSTYCMLRMSLFAVSDDAWLRCFEFQFDGIFRTSCHSPSPYHPGNMPIVEIGRLATVSRNGCIRPSRICWAFANENPDKASVRSVGCLIEHQSLWARYCSSFFNYDQIYAIRTYVGLPGQVQLVRAHLLCRPYRRRTKDKEVSNRDTNLTIPFRTSRLESQPERVRK